MATARDNLQQRKKAAFLEAYAACGTVTHAAQTAGIDRATHYRWMESDAEYAAAFEEAGKQAADALEREARRRAIEGVDEPVWHKGQQVGAVRKYSDTLLIFLLKGALPAKYAERSRAEISGPDGSPIQSDVAHGLTPEAAAWLLDLRRRAAAERAGGEAKGGAE